MGGGIFVHVTGRWFTEPRTGELLPFPYRMRRYLMNDPRAHMTLGHIDDRCAATGENPVDVLELVVASINARAKFLSTDTLEVVS